MYAIAAYINVIQLKGVIARVAGVTYPGRKASANFCLRRFRIIPQRNFRRDSLKTGSQLAPWDVRILRGGTRSPRETTQQPR